MYSTEAELVQNFTRHSHSFLKEVTGRKVRTPFVLNEFDCSDGIADIVIGTYTKVSPARLRQIPIRLDWAQEIHRISDLPIINYESISRIYGTSNTVSKKLVAELYSNNYLIKVDDNNFKFRIKYKNTVQFVVAIEAKLKKWNRAIAQAYRYKKFSDLTYVLIDRNFCKPAIENRQVFFKYNIGLIAMDSCGYEIMINPLHLNKKRATSVSRINEAVVNYLRSSNLG
jgi:hypothetical protein